MNHIGGVNEGTHKLVNGKPVVTPDMVAPANGTERLLVNFAITIMRRLKEPLQGFKTITGGLKVPTTDTEAEQELTQFEIKWDRWPVPEAYVDKACSDMALAIKQNLKKNGLMK